MMRLHPLDGSTSLTSIRVFCRILLPYLGYNFAQNVTSSSVGGSDYLSQISSKFIQYSCEEKEMPMLARNTGTSGQRDIVKT